MSTGHLTPEGESHGSQSEYVAGFVLAAVLTGAAFWIATAGALSAAATAGAVAMLAVVQIMVHLRFFLHLNGSSAQRWNVMAFAFAVLVVAIVVGGTFWVMQNANDLMMPMTPAAAMDAE